MDTTGATAQPVDLGQLEGSGGVVWSVSPAGFHANLVVLDGGEAIAAHRNDEVDVLIIVLLGSATLTADGVPIAMSELHSVVVPRGVVRELRAGADGARYLTVHARRSLGVRSATTSG